MSTGTIYHHLDTLSTLIEQKEDKKYYLTDLGRLAYNSLLDNIKTISSPSESRDFQSPIIKGLMFLTPKKIIAFDEKNKLFVILITATLIGLGAVLCGLTGLFSFLLYFIPFPSEINLSDINTRIFISIVFILNFLVYFLIVEGLCRIFYKKKENSLKFFESFGIIFFPIVCYLAIHLIFMSFGVIDTAIFNGIDNVMLIFFQVWSLWLLTFNLNKNKKLKIENGLIISFILHYGGFTILLFLLL